MQTLNIELVDGSGLIRLIALGIVADVCPLATVATALRALFRIKTFGFSRW